MPRRTDISSILVIGSGPIVIGQAAEFDYSGTQACRVLTGEGYRVILVNSNPATIMTDPEFADATYIEPITPEVVEKIIEKERPDALLATLGGQTALNTASTLFETGVLDKYGVEMIGASFQAIQRGENRELFKQVVEEIDLPGAECARSRICHTMDEVIETAEEIGYPLVVRPSFTMGGVGSGFAHNEAELRDIAGKGLEASLHTEVLIEESILGWKELELELMRDSADNVVVICTIENVDPVGVHTGDSITVAPAMTLNDDEIQQMIDLGTAIIRGVGVESGGCNLQFAIDPDSGRMITIEMNPRVSRSSALASKATGYPIAKVAAKVAVGYTLDEIDADTSTDVQYAVVKVPRFAFEKFPAADQTLTTHMKSVGEVMSLGATLPEALGKALRSLEDDRAPFVFHADDSKEELLRVAAEPRDSRLGCVMRAIAAGATSTEIYEATGITGWFVDQFVAVYDAAMRVRSADALTANLLRDAKAHGLSDDQIAELRGLDAQVVRELRWALDVVPGFPAVQTYASSADSTYRYSSYASDAAIPGRDRPAIIIVGAGPNRIGQGVEFDYSCVHAAMAVSDAGYESIMINCNPETVSTDYDTSDRLYFEPLTVEDVLEVYRAEAAAGPVAGVLVQLGGQTPLKLAQALQKAGVPIIGTSPDAIHLAEERGAFERVLADANLPAPRHGMAHSFDEAREIARAIGYPVLVRPSYVLGGRGMEIVYDEASLELYIRQSTLVSPDNPILVDRFLDDAVELDVDALYDGEQLFLGGVMEHIEEAGVHSGDSACCLPPLTLSDDVIARVRDYTEAIAKGVGVRGLINIQYALQGDTLYVLEANPRASRTVPFVSKATGAPLAKAAALIMAGHSIANLQAEGLLPEQTLAIDADTPFAVKEAVMPFNRFRTPEGGTVDSVLGPEMRSTGEVMGFDQDFGVAFAKSQMASGGPLPTEGTVLVSVANRDKRHIVFPVRALQNMGFRILATQGTASVLRRHGVEVETVAKIGEPTEPNQDLVSRIKAGEINLIFNTPQGQTSGGAPRSDGYEIRTAAVIAQIPYVTTIPGLEACVQGIAAMREQQVGVRSLQSWHRS